MADLSLNHAREAAGLGMTDLWLRYFALGGDSTPIELDAYLHGALEPTAAERILIVHALHECHVEQRAADQRRPGLGDTD